MSQLCRWAVVHWVRFDRKRTAAELHLSAEPKGCASWKAGPDLRPSAGAGRSGSRIWCGIASFRELPDAEAAFDWPETYLPDCSDASEAWRALLVPFAHKGECNHLNSSSAGLLFEVQNRHSGPLMVMTTAGFDLRSRADYQRLIHFRRSVDRMRDTIQAAEGSLAHQVFTPEGAGDDGITMSLWRDEKSMFTFAYRPGAHRVQVDRQNSARTVDRSSFTRFHLLRSAGQWGGADPLVHSRCN